MLFCGIGGLAFGQTDGTISNTSLETYNCTKEREKLESWRNIAGSISRDVALERANKSAEQVEIVEVTASDRRTLRGFRFPSSTESLGNLLIVQGNAWRADQFAPEASILAESGYNVYIFDYRGYGISAPGNPTVSAIIDDYKVISMWLARLPGTSHLYAFSGGGVVAINAVNALEESLFATIVLDATPSKLEYVRLSCTVNYDPIEKLPADCGRYVAIRGTRDLVVRTRKTTELLDAVTQCGGKAVSRFRGHPFQLEMPWTRRGRLKDILAELRPD
jgi:pimeloyl-ACP methyl ester carboxylesterase